jgi:hypothetical protein
VVPFGDHRLRVIARDSSGLTAARSFYVYGRNSAPVYNTGISNRTAHTGSSFMILPTKNGHGLKRHFSPQTPPG